MKEINKKVNLKNVLRTVILIGFGVLVAQNAFAYQLGNAQIKVRTGVTETYDDNITYADTNLIKDYITNFLLGLDLIYEGKLNSLVVSGNLNYEDFNKHSTFNNLAEDISATYKQELSKFDRFSVKDTFVHAEEPRSFEDEFGRTSGRYAYYRNIFNIGYNKDVSKNLTLSTNYTNEVDTYSRSDLADAYFNALGFGADYAISSETILLAGYDFTVRTFNPGSNAYTNALTGGIRQYLTSQLSIEGRAGIDFIKSYDKKDYTKPVFILSLIDEIDETTKFTLSFKKEYFNNAYSRDLFNQWRVSAGFNKQLTERFSANISGFYGNGKYVESDISDDLRGISAGFGYDIRDNCKLDLGYSYSETISNVDTREYKKNVVNLGLKIIF